MYGQQLYETGLRSFLSLHVARADEGSNLGLAARMQVLRVCSVVRPSRNIMQVLGPGIINTY